MRRLTDIFLALILLAFTGPLALLLAAWIRLDSPGPALYTPVMLGLDGRPFRLLRFRTMRIAGITETAPEQRLTRAGRFLRRYSLDHLPMVLNLLAGDLTLVGPRPIEPGVVVGGDATWARYFSVKPGIINYSVLKLGRTWTPLRASRPDLNQELELAYLEKRCFWQDARLVIRSLLALVKSRGNIKERGEPEK